MIANADPAACLAPYADEVRAAVERVLRSGRFVLGPDVEAFEREFAAWLGAKWCLGVASGTDALELALRAVGIGSDDGVLVPANTASATVAAVMAIGARPVFCDVDAATMCLGPARTRALLDSPRGAGVQAVVPVHLYGHPCDMPAIMALAADRGLRVVEDCAQAHGAAYDGRRVGAWGHAGAFSFYPTKNLAALGDGGAVTTGDPVIAESVRALRQYGWRERYVSAGDGGRNSRLDEIQAAVLRVRLRHLEGENRRRRASAGLYSASLADTGLRLPPRGDGPTEAVFHQYVVRSPRRDALRDWLAERGVTAQVLYPVAASRQPAFARWAPPAGEVAESERCCDEVLSLPVHSGLGDEAVLAVCEAVKAWAAAR